MRTCSLLLLLIGGGSYGEALAEDFQTASAKKAEQKFLKALKAARGAYIADLDAAAKQAIKNDNLDEAIRIKEKVKDLRSQQEFDRGDPVVQLRRNLRNTTWRYNRSDKPATPETMRFHAKNRITKVLGKRMASGVWESLDSKVAIAKFKETLYLFLFDDRLKTFRVLAFGPIKSVYVSGKRIR